MGKICFINKKLVNWVLDSGACAHISNPIIDIVNIRNIENKNHSSPHLIEQK